MDTTTQNNTTSIISNLLAAYQQKQLMDVNADRARQGLAPISASDAGMQAQVGVGLDVQTRNVVIGGIVVLGLIGLALVLKR